MKKKGRKGRKRVRWVTTYTIKHWRSGKIIRRKDGLPFRFPVFS